MANLEHIKISEEAKNFLASNHQLLIDGEWVSSTSGEKIPVFDPGTEAKIAEVDSGNEDDISLAVSAARKALTGEWSKIPSHDRAQLLNKLADDIDTCLPLLAELEVLDNGMPLALAHYSIAGHGTTLLRYYAGWATKIQGDTIPVKKRTNRCRWSNYSLELAVDFCNPKASPCFGSWLYRCLEAS